MTSPLTVAGVCSGIGGFSLGFLRAGFRVLWECESDPMASAVLKQHFPDAVHYNNLLDDDIFTAQPPHVLTGGTPCQGFSLAGLRLGLADDRSNLCLRFCELAARFPRSFVVWENVPGVLSQPDNAFGTFLAALVGADEPLLPSPIPAPGEKLGRYWRKGKTSADQPVPKWPRAGVVSGPLRTASWRCLDAQYLGVAQRRQRVFVVADTGDGSSPQILFEPEGLRRDTPPRRGKREDVALTLSARTQGGGGLGTDFEVDGGLIPGVHGVPDVALPLCSRAHLGHDDSRDTLIPEIVGTLCSNGKASGIATQQDAEQGMLVPCVFKPSHFTRGKDGAPSPISPPLTADADKGDQEPVVLAFSGRERGDDGRGYARPPQVTSDITGTLDTVKPWSVAFGGNNTSGPIESTPALTCNRGNHSGDFEAGTLLVCDSPTIAFPERLGSTACASTENLSPCLGSQNPKTVAQPTAFRACGQDGFTPRDVCPPVAATTGGSAGMPCVHSGYTVRRLTPRECDRLQAFPDDWGLIPYKGKPMSDSARYKQLGNAVCVNVAHWLANRISQHLRPTI